MHFVGGALILTKIELISTTQDLIFQGNAKKYYNDFNPSIVMANAKIKEGHLSLTRAVTMTNLICLGKCPAD